MTLLDLSLAREMDRERGTLRVAPSAKAPLLRY